MDPPWIPHGFPVNSDATIRHLFAFEWISGLRHRRAMADGEEWES